MVLSTPFTCPNGHSFQANAKLRARCPDCGTMARKSFSEKKSPVPVTSTEPEPKEDPKDDKETTPEPKESIKSAPKAKAIKVLRRGRNSMPKVAVSAKSKIKPKGLVSNKKLKRAAVPIVRGRPKGNKEHKIVEDDRPYWHKVKDAYWIP